MWNAVELWGFNHDLTTSIRLIPVHQFSKNLSPPPEAHLRKGAPIFPSTAY